MRLPSETKQQLFFRNLVAENGLLYSGLGVFLAVAGTRTVAQAFLLGSVALFLSLLNSLLSSFIGDLFRIKVRLPLLVALNSLVVSLVGAAFAARIAQMPQWTMACLLLCSASPLVYSRSQAFAHGTSVGRALFDAAGAGAGLVAALCAIAALRELAGLGTLGNYAVFSRAPWPLMGTAFGGFALSGLFIVAFRRLMPEPQA